MNKKKTQRVTTEGLSKNRNFNNAGSIAKCFDIFDFTEKRQEIQCQKCNPLISKPSGAVKLCANCEAESKETATVFFDNFRQHRRIIKLNRYCFACSSPKSEAMMSKVLPICSGCAGELRAKGATARNNFIARTLNNFHKKLKGAVV